MNRWVSRSMGIALTLTVLLGLLCFSVLDVGQSESYFAGSFSRYRTWEAAGLSQDDALRVARAFSAYLTGDVHALSLEAEIGGTYQPIFHERELSHMEDVYHLFALAQQILLACGGCVVVLVALVLSFRSRWDPAVLWRSVWITLAIFAALLFGVILWATIDFTSLFHGFHRLFFQNELWLMDPATDRMIQLMPQAMFQDGALSIVWRFCLGLALYTSACFLYTHKAGKKTV